MLDNTQIGLGWNVIIEARIKEISTMAQLMWPRAGYYACLLRLKDVLCDILRRQLQGYRLELRLTLNSNFRAEWLTLFTFLVLGIETWLISFKCMKKELDMTPISVRAKQNLHSVKLRLCPSVLFLGPEKIENLAKNEHNSIFLHKYRR